MPDTDPSPAWVPSCPPGPGSAPQCSFPSLLPLPAVVKHCPHLVLLHSTLHPDLTSWLTSTSPSTAATSHSLSLHFCFKRRRTSTPRCHLHIASTSPPAHLHLPHTPSSLPITTRRWTEAPRPSHHARSQTTLSPPLQHPTLKGHALIYFPASLLLRSLERGL